MSRRAASGGRTPARPGRGTRLGKRAGGKQTSGGSRGSGSSHTKVVFDAPVPADHPRVLRLGAVPGATPGRWIDTWQERMPHVRLELVPILFASQRAALIDGAVDLALVRAPFAKEGMHVIGLYEELPVVIASTGSHLLAAEELSADDLEGETLLEYADDVLGPLGLPTTAARIPPLQNVGEAIATAAAGAGIVVAPMSLARLHHRKDTDHRVLRDGPRSRVLLAWPADTTTADIESFVGIVRGRTARSSR